MAGRGPAPSLPGQRRRRNSPAAGEWASLPSEGRKGRIPKWPLPNPPRPAVAELWRKVWRTPQATMWDGMGLGIELQVARWANLTIDVASGELSATAQMSSLPELRQIEDRLGLNPKGMQDRRWRIADIEEVPEAGSTADGPGASVSRLDDRRRRLTDAS